MTNRVAVTFFRGWPAVSAALVYAAVSPVLATGVPGVPPANAGQPLAVAPADHAKVIRVAVVPFRPLRADAATDWIGEGIEQALLAELAKLKNVELRDVPNVTQLDTAATLAAAKASAAEVVVLGTFQTTADEVRATGRVMLVSGRQVAVISSRAGLKEVFRLQDDLARQVREAILGQAPTATPETAPPLGNPSQTTDPAQPIPFPGSALDRALQDELAGRHPWDGTQATRPEVPPPRIGSVENPNGWGALGSGYWGGGYWGGLGPRIGYGPPQPPRMPFPPPDGAPPPSPSNPPPTDPGPTKPTLINPFAPGANSKTTIKGGPGGGGGATGP